MFHRQIVPVVVFFMFPLLSLNGCLLLDSDCPLRSYCVDDELWQCDGPGEWSGCDDFMEEDCTLSGKVCREFKSGPDSSAGCFYDEVSCPDGAYSMCNNDILYNCNLYAGLPDDRRDCSLTEQTCVEYSADNYQQAKCFYSNIHCDTDEPSVCNDDFAYTCVAAVGMADERYDCRQNGHVCIDTVEWGSLCTPECTDEPGRCSADGGWVLDCDGSVWRPLQLCSPDMECGMFDVSGVAGPECVEKFCPDTGGDAVSRCEGNYWVHQCDTEADSELCEFGCLEFEYRQGSSRVQCNRESY